MQAFPHRYPVNASATADSRVTLTVDSLPAIVSDAPAEFGGPGDCWSPESLLVAAVADCFVLSFRAIARASRLEWTELHCSVTGVLDRVERTTQFTAIEVSAELIVAAGTDADKAEKLLHKAEAGCLITNSLKADRQLSTQVRVAD